VALDIQQRVARMGHDADVVYSGKQAIAQIAKASYDLVLMDIKLDAGMDGIDTACALRSVIDVPVIYLTAYADAQTLERARATEPYGYLLKPLHERELMAAIDMARQRHATDHLLWEQQQLQRFLAEAEARLVTSLDYRAIVRDLAELLVPRYADWCLIHLAEAADANPSYLCTRPDGEEEMGAPPPALFETVEREARPEIASTEDVESLAAAIGASRVASLRNIGVRSLVCVPLMAREQVLGALAMLSGQAHPRYTATELVFIQDLGRQLGLALDNALLYRKAERAVRLRDEVLAIVSHDLRAPLGTIMLEADLLALKSDARTRAESITRSAQRMSRLIGDLVDASAINAGRLSLDIRAHDTAEVVHEAFEMFHALAEDHGITLTASAPERRTLIACDRDRILQVLSNLISNALKFTPRHGAITLSAEQQDREVLFAVRDTGAGIPAVHIPHLFERFWRTQGHRNGAGLGLFIVHGILAAHDTQIHVESAVGSGSRFYFSLPCV
jgi:signal transduction histidine kinase